MSNEADTPFDRWHKKYPKEGDTRCNCGTKKNPLYESADHGRGQRWQARFTDPAGKQRRPAFDAYQDAADHLTEIRAQMRNGTWVEPELGAQKVEIYTAKFIAGRRKFGKHEATTKSYEGHIRRYVNEFAGHRTAKTLTRRDSTNFVAWLMDQPGLKSSASVVQVFRTWRIVMNHLIDEEEVPLPANICSRIKLPEVLPRVEVALSPTDVTELAAAMREIEPRYEISIWIAACAGLRKGEVFGLRSAAVAWDEDLLYIVEQRQAGRASKLKTRASYVTLPVDHFLIERLDEHRRTHPRIRPVSPVTERTRKARGYVEARDEGLMITNALGKPVLHHDFWLKWKAAVRLAGLPERTRFHDLKHFYTSKLGASGLDPKTVQALCRHATFEETWDTYAHPPMAVEGVKVRAFGLMFGSDDPGALAA
ncbi:site-specific integrase [Actinacidiphila alni]|nr:site-specific integrase [Actinacidiphila alni]